MNTEQPIPYTLTAAAWDEWPLITLAARGDDARLALHRCLQMMTRALRYLSKPSTTSAARVHLEFAIQDFATSERVADQCLTDYPLCAEDTRRAITAKLLEAWGRK